MLGPSALRPGIASLRAARPVLTSWLLLGLVTTLPYVAAALLPPPGRTFAGTFHWIDDFYNYVSFVQQAEDGRLVFHNKLVLEDHEAALVNLEWWVVGVLSRLLGRQPFVAYRLFSLLVLAGLLLAVDRALRRLGLPDSHRLPALLLVATGGGLGGLLFELTPRPVFRCADLAVGMFPFLEILANPHWLAGTWLLLETLLAFDGPAGAGSPGRIMGAGGAWKAVVFGSALGLVRPYDLVLAASVLALGVVLGRPAREWWRALIPLVGLAPVVLYNAFVFYAISTFATYASTRYEMPPVTDFLWGLAPAAVLAALSLRQPAADEAQRALRLKLWVWAGLAFLAVVARPVPFTQQFAIGAGLPLLVLTGVSLLRFRPLVAAALVAAFSTTAIVALRVVFRSEHHWHVLAERREAALAMRPTCQPGGLAFSPPDIGLYTIGLTACRAFTSHPWEPDHAERTAVVQAFYGDMPPTQRRTLLDRWKVTHLVLPGDAGPTAQGFLGEGSAFAQIARLGGPPGGTASVYLRIR